MRVANIGRSSRFSLGKRMAPREAAVRGQRAPRTGRWMAVARALVILLLLPWSGTAGASVIFGPPQQPRLDSRAPFLFELFVPRADLDPSACDLTPQADQLLPQAAAQVGTPSVERLRTVAPIRKAAVGMVHSPGPAPWLVPRSEVSHLEWAIGGPTEPDAKGLTATAGLAAMGLIKVRLDRIESCRRYLLHLLEMINRIVLNLKGEERIFAFNFESQIKLNATKFSAVADPVQTAPVAPAISFSLGRVPALGSPTAQRTAVHHYRVKAANPSNAGAEGAKPESQKKKTRSPGEKLTIKDFVLDIISHPYAYVVLFMAVVLTIIFQRQLQ